MATKKNTKKRSNGKNKDPKNIIPAWEGWRDYFFSEDGRKNICSMLTICMEHSLRYSKNRGMFSGYNSIMEPCELAVELIAIDPILKEVVPADAMNQVGDLSAAIDLAKLVGGQHKECPMQNRLFEEIYKSIRTSMVLMSRGVRDIRISYTGGSDQCDSDGCIITRNPIGTEEYGEYDCSSKEVQSFMLAWGIDIESYWMFCDDSGAGDGTGYWTAQVIAELVPEFYGYTTEPDFHEYECDCCGESQSDCSCSRCESCYELFENEEVVGAAGPKSKFCESCRPHEQEDADKPTGETPARKRSGTQA